MAPTSSAVSTRHQFTRGRLGLAHRRMGRAPTREHQSFSASSWQISYRCGLVADRWVYLTGRGVRYNQRYNLASGTDGRVGLHHDNAA
jgi:hypothetical protein